MLVWEFFGSAIVDPWIDLKDFKMLIFLAPQVGIFGYRCSHERLYCPRIKVEEQYRPVRPFVSGLILMLIVAQNLSFIRSYKSGTLLLKLLPRNSTGCGVVTDFLPYRLCTE